MKKYQEVLENLQEEEQLDEAALIRKHFIMFADFLNSNLGMIKNPEAFVREFAGLLRSTNSNFKKETFINRALGL